jgi:ribosomal protein S18 acetylase RimI-like enzyme
MTTSAATGRTAQESTPGLVAGPIDRARAVAALVAAFSSDPVIRWVYPDAERYLTHFPGALGVMAGQAFDAGTADCAEGYVGAALWLAPDVEPDGDAILELAGRSVDPDRHDDLFLLLETMQEHHPAEPCWYLPFIGVDPRCQGQGHGSRLLAAALLRCDEDRLLAYLEASTPRNRALYERHGFEVTAEIRVADCPPLWPMVRPAR